MKQVYINVYHNVINYNVGAQSKLRLQLLQRESISYRESNAIADVLKDFNYNHHSANYGKVRRAHNDRRFTFLLNTIVLFEIALIAWALK